MAAALVMRPAAARVNLVAAGARHKGVRCRFRDSSQKTRGALAAGGRSRVQSGCGSFHAAAGVARTRSPRGQGPSATAVYIPPWGRSCDLRAHVGGWRVRGRAVRQTGATFFQSHSHRVEVCDDVLVIMVSVSAGMCHASMDASRHGPRGAREQLGNAYWAQSAPEHPGGATTTRRPLLSDHLRAAARGRRTLATIRRRKRRLRGDVVEVMLSLEGRVAGVARTTRTGWCSGLQWCACHIVSIHGRVAS